MQGEGIDDFIPFVVFLQAEQIHLPRKQDHTLFTGRGNDIVFPIREIYP